MLGTPSRDEIYNMNPNYTDFRFPSIKKHHWNKVLMKDDRSGGGEEDHAKWEKDRKDAEEATDLVGNFSLAPVACFGL